MKIIITISLLFITLQAQSGSYKTDWNAAGYSSGIYFYIISSGSFIETKKMLLIK